MQDKQILVGIGGSVACCKALELVRLLRGAGVRVRCAPTRSAQAFITPLLFEAVSGCAPATDVLSMEDAYAADAAVVAPATCNLLARMAAGIADEALLAALLSFRAPIIVAPTMETRLWEHPATQANVHRLAERGVRIVSPQEDAPGSGRSSRERPADVQRIFDAVHDALTPKTLAGRRLVLTAGPTCEDLDPVRYLTNRSSGKMGIALAAAAARRGAEVTLVHGPVQVRIPEVPTLHGIPVRSAREMHAAVMSAADGADIAVMCAAVADFTPARTATHKLKKDAGALTRLELVRTPDILASLGALERRPFLVGFAAETNGLDEAARGKLERKNCNLLCANDVSEIGCGFGVDTNRITVYRRNGEPVALPLLPKTEAAERIVDLIEESLYCQLRKA
ncbi:MAG: bifunctional phosphopantothenoylcysteine decarboxylase/phosphopantothenate--cysteine ligase CoaBC [Lentisphaerae bacterium]|nr:bifunctional phosphopantothenoylcysteine decarboxylase/phosphopantothenate--cysteine ligase CoaBC [Lentisphaerota bacterium]